MISALGAKLPVRKSFRAGRDWGVTGQHVRRQFVRERAKCPNFQMMRTGSTAASPRLLLK